MSTIEFVKMQGSGNDFIMIDNRREVVPAAQQRAFVQTVCPRGLAVGADGVIFIENDAELDFRWAFYNADGSTAAMCGNGARCAAAFAHRIGAAGREMRFRTGAGPIAASLTANGARVQLTDAPAPERVAGLNVSGTPEAVYFTNTGVPHVVVPLADAAALEKADILKTGAALRYHAHFAPAGTNVNFMCRDGAGIAVRTYERGVEGETLACGTGSVASAMVAAEFYGLACPVAVRTRGGIVLEISFRRGGAKLTEVFLAGPAVRVYEGRLEWAG